MSEWLAGVGGAVAGIAVTGVVGAVRDRIAYDRQRGDQLGDAAAGKHAEGVESARVILAELKYFKEAFDQIADDPGRRIVVPVRTALIDKYSWHQERLMRAMSPEDGGAVADAVGACEWLLKGVVLLQSGVTRLPARHDATFEAHRAGVDRGMDALHRLAYSPAPPVNENMPATNHEGQ